jgi:hypothetical protein
VFNALDGSYGAVPAVARAYKAKGVKWVVMQTPFSVVSFVLVLILVVFVLHR